MIEFRPSQPSDAEGLLEIWRAAVDASHHFLSAEDCAAIDPLVADYVRSAPLTVALLDRRVAAFMGVSGRNIDSLWVQPDAQGKGIGTAMVNRVPRPATVDVNEQNEAGAAFYRRRDFKVIGRSELDDQGRPYPLLHMRRD